MLDLNLCVPVFLESQLKEIAKGTDFSISEIRHLAYHAGPALGIFTAGDKKGTLLPIQDEEVDEEGTHTLRSKKDIPTSDFLIGTDAVIWLCLEKAINVEPLAKISIPDSVYYECDKDQWSDICSFFADVSRQNSRANRLITMGVPSVIAQNESRMLWEAVELLEAGHIGNTNRRWNHGRILRALNDIGFSLVGGWEPAMRELIEVGEETEEEKKARRHRAYEQRVSFYANYYVKNGMEPGEAMSHALFQAAGDPAFRACSIEGMGFWFPDMIRQGIVAEFLKNHSAAFVQSEAEEKIYERIQAGDELDEVFDGSKYESDGGRSGNEHWAVAIANVMSRETGIGFSVYLNDPDSRYSNRNCILFEEMPPWLYNEKEKKLSKNMLYQILDRYALELHMTVSDCYYIMDFFDE